MDKELFNAILRISFKSFVEKVFLEVSPNSKYLDNWHIDVICSELGDILDGKNHRLIVNIPPRYMKSIICSVAYPAYILGINPKATIIAVSYNDELSQKLALDCKRVMESHWYQELFPRTKISKSRRSISDFETTLGGGRFSTSVNGTLTGRGADYLIIDDPIKPDDANSETIRTKTNEWYGSTLYSRLNNKNTGNVIVIMQRLHDEDFTGYLLNTDSTFRHIKIPAIAEHDEEWVINNRIFRRKKGEALHPARESVEKLYEAKKQMGEYNFSGQYQQNPAPIEGGIIKKKWFKYYDPLELQKAIDRREINIVCCIQSWDTASKIEQYNDYSVCLTALLDSHNNYYIIDCFRGKLEFPDLVRQLKIQYEWAQKKFDTVRVLVEDKNSGTQLIQTLANTSGIIVAPVKPEHDKQTRLMSVSHLIENGSCLFPADNPAWLYDLEQELLRFPKGRYDDQCDALSQLLNQECSVSLLDYFL